MNNRRIQNIIKILDGAINSFNLGDVPRALRTLTDLTENYEEAERYLEIHYWLGRCEREMGYYSSAIISYSKSLRLFENNPPPENSMWLARILHAMGITQQLAGDYEDAIGSFRRGLDSIPKPAAPQLISLVEIAILNSLGLTHKLKTEKQYEILATKGEFEGRVIGNSYEMPDITYEAAEYYYTLAWQLLIDRALAELLPGEKSRFWAKPSEESLTKDDFYTMFYAGGLTPSLSKDKWFATVSYNIGRLRMDDKFLGADLEGAYKAFFEALDNLPENEEYPELWDNIILLYEWMMEDMEIDGWKELPDPIALGSKNFSSHMLKFIKLNGLLEEVDNT